MTLKLRLLRRCTGFTLYNRIGKDQSRNAGNWDSFPRNDSLRARAKLYWKWWKLSIRWVRYSRGQKTRDTRSYSDTYHRREMKLVPFFIEKCPL